MTTPKEGVGDGGPAFPVPNLDDVQVAFGDALDWMPKPGNIPKVDEKWGQIAAKWFYFGLPKITDFTPKPGVDRRAALRAMKACLGSFAPKHEHKMEAAAFMLSEWFSDITGWDVETEEERKLKARPSGARP